MTTIRIIATILLFNAFAAAQEPNEPIKPIAPESLEQHKQLLARAKRGDIDIVFFGDSGTSGWTTTGQDVWKKQLEPLKAANFGVGGNSIGQLLWRLQNGQIEGFKPKVVVLWIGHVDIFQNKRCAPEISKGIMACAQEIQKKQPDTKIVLMALFQDYPQWTETQHATVVDVNKRLAKQAADMKIRFLDVNERFAARKQDLLKELAEVKDPHKLTLMYTTWGEALQEPLREMLAEKPKRTLEHFQKTLEKAFTPVKTVSVFGEPDRRLGSGLIIFEYNLDDGTKILLGFPGMGPLQYAIHIQKDGKCAAVLEK